MQRPWLGSTAAIHLRTIEAVDTRFLPVVLSWRLRGGINLLIMAPALCTWNANNAAPHIRRAIAISRHCARECLATWLMGSISPPPRYTEATKLLLTFSVFMGVLALLNILYLACENGKKAKVRKGTPRSEEEPDLWTKAHTSASSVSYSCRYKDEIIRTWAT
ncbi:hypothetical protein GGX14DRAFT_583400 [Mycena pura]|uniref:Uncharacterized protein n=1 Tax=Mycena pura TaxID=153505 RepID=A0AAD6YVB8_9AGAR|nr:hypothetical protein GGX14DRAFT_583400 [Mycena pura]